MEKNVRETLLLNIGPGSPAVRIAFLFVLYFGFVVGGIGFLFICFVWG